MTGLAGCTGDDADAGGGAPAAMTFLHFETQEQRVDLIDGIGEEWTEETGTSLNQRAVAEGDLPVEIQASIAADDIPATAELPAGTLFDTRGLVNEDVTNEVIDELGEDSFYDKTLEFVSDGEDYLGVPLYFWTSLYGWDEDYRQENGLPVPDSWEDFEEFAEFTHDPDNNQFGCLVGTDNSPYTLQSFQPFALSNDAHVFDEDGNIIFDNQEMVEALEYYGVLGNLTPPGETGSDDFGAWEERQTYNYVSNTISYWFETAFLGEGEAVEGWDATLTIEGPEKEATFGETVSLTSMETGSESQARASRSFIGKMHETEGGADSPYVSFCHIRPGLFNPTRPDVLNSDAFRNEHPEDLFEKWEDEWRDEDIPNAIGVAERFGRRGNNVFPAIGDIVGQNLITNAIQRVVDGENAETVANEAAEDMRDIVD